MKKHKIIKKGSIFFTIVILMFSLFTSVISAYTDVPPNGRSANDKDRMQFNKVYTNEFKAWSSNVQFCYFLPKNKRDSKDYLKITQSNNSICTYSIYMYNGTKQVSVKKRQKNKTWEIPQNVTSVDIVTENGAGLFSTKRTIKAQFTDNK